MDISLFDYELPAELIAQRPAEQRSASRLLALNRDTGAISHTQFSELPNYLRAGDCLVLNDTRVFKARLLGGQRATGGAVEVFLVRPESETRWLALARPSGRLKEGERIFFDDDSLTLAERRGDGVWLVEFADSAARERLIERFGAVPLPPYISRGADDTDLDRYQTVFAAPDKARAVAAPTAGLHFDEAMLRRLRESGVRVVYLTLHVGPGTFKPVVVEDIAEHTVDPEWAELSAAAATVINETKAAGGSVVAVGTTVVRTLECAALRSTGELKPFAGLVDLYIQPGHEFRVVDEMLTNFHLPKSSLLILVSAFAGRENVLRAYQEAVVERYRFYSYGDCMLIHSRGVQP